ncbi:MAG: tetratricopeptide repeat protein [Betaproteobacteria bacterium]
MTDPFAPPRSRNDPCPCGSGKRYKHCHGSDEPPGDGYVPADPAQGPLEAARALLRAGRHEEAVAVLDAAGVDHEADPAGWRLLGEALRPSDTKRSRAYWMRVVEVAPADPEVHFFLGDLDREAGDIEGAIAHFTQAQQAAPDHPALLNNLGLALEKAQRFEEAEAHFRRVLELSPDALIGIANLAQNLYQQKRFKESLPYFDRLIERMPAAPVEIWANRGIAYRMCANYPTAEASMAKAVELAPELADLWRELGLTRASQHLWGTAAIALARSYELDPSSVFTEAMLLYVHGYEAYWRDFDRLRADILAHATKPGAADDNASIVVPFSFQSINEDPTIELAVARRWARTQFLPVNHVRPARRAPEARLRIGFVSADFYMHPVGRLIVGLLERLDRDRFTVHAYATGKDRNDEVRQRIVAACEVFRSFPIVDATEIADAIRADGIDVLFDLTGFTADAAVSAFSLRPAPVQINFLGFTGTMGTPAFDWILTDRFCVPEDVRHLYDERPLYVDPCYLPSDVARAVSPDPVSRADYKLPADATVFAALISAHKIVPEHFDAWLDILAGVPDSILWLRDQPSTVMRRLEHIATKRDLDPSRLRCAPNEPVPRYLKRFPLADLYIDTMPFGGHTTVNDALFAGVPVLTAAGRSFASRASASQVLAAGLPELVVASREEYVARAIVLGNDRPRLAAMAEQLRATRDTLPLFDLDRYARAFEAAIERAWSETSAA